MTRDQRAAITECVRLIELLLDSSKPEAKTLGMIVMTRIEAIGRAGAGAILSDGDATTWVELARQNLPADVAQEIGKLKAFQCARRKAGL